MKVKNIPGTAELSCTCESWIEHWEKFSREKTPDCSVVGCSAEAEVGAHVHLSYSGKSACNDSYIVPLCENHNATPEDEEL